MEGVAERLQTGLPFWIVLLMELAVAIGGAMPNMPERR